MKKKIFYAIIVCLMTLVCFTAMNKIIMSAQKTFRPYCYFLSLPFPMFLGIIVNLNDLKCSFRQKHKEIDWMYLLLLIFFLSAIVYSFYFKANLIMMLLSAYSAGCIIPKLFKKKDQDI